MRGIACVLLAIPLMFSPLAAQDFGFDDEDAGESGGGFGQGGGGSPLAVSIGGEVQASVIGFFDDFAEGASHTRFGDIFSGKLNFKADTSLATGTINLKLRPSESPVVIDEAYIGAYFGSLDIEAGLRKLTWGKADSSGPLDVINPVDYSDLSGMGDSASLKIARPLIRASFHFGQFNKLEGVFVPTFEPMKFADTGRWAPVQFAALSQFPSETIIKPDTTTLEYAQAGIRFTTTIGGAVDIGTQYYYGRMTSPVVIQTPSADPQFPIVTFSYNPYHQIGFDYAQVIAGFNLRAELAANVTEDLDGDDGTVYNPSFAWSIGFDREVFWRITLNVQCNETIRLLDSKIDDPQDIEAGSDITSTSLVVALTKSFLRDELELEAAALWDIENGACLIMPGLTWTKDDVTVELLAGIFAGGDEGLFGQFHGNSFIKASIRYSF
ncbi:MAG: hypothetical protein LBB22_05610 [Treponema sp.]|jgi:hypothetical protein|nr:hypothetical protein [Treponema sp.]